MDGEAIVKDAPQDRDKKASALIAGFARDGHTVEAFPSGEYLVSRRGAYCYCANYADLHSLAFRLGVVATAGGDS